MIKKRILMLSSACVLLSPLHASGSSTNYGVVPVIGAATAPSWDTNINPYLQQLDGNNFSGFQYFDEQGNFYFLSDTQLSAFSTACSQQVGQTTSATTGASAQAVQATINKYPAGGKAWQTVNVPVTTIANSILGFPFRTGALAIDSNGNYGPLSTVSQNTGCNSIQLHQNQMQQVLNAGGTTNFSSMSIESSPYYYAALIQNYIGRVATAANGLAPLFAYKGTYSGNVIDNTPIVSNFTNQAVYYLQRIQYALAALGSPLAEWPGSFIPLNESSAQTSSNAQTSSATQTNNQETTINYSGPSSGTTTGGTTAPWTSDPWNSGASNASVTQQTTDTPTVSYPYTSGNPTLSLLDTFMGVVLVNNVLPATQSGTAFIPTFYAVTNTATIPSNATLVQALNSNQGFIFSATRDNQRNSGFIPVPGTADSWTPVSNGSSIGRSVGINCGLLQSASSGLTLASTGQTLNYTIALTSVSNPTSVAVFDNDAMTGTPIATFDLNNFFAMPTPWALVIEVSGFVSMQTMTNSQGQSGTSACIIITPAAMNIRQKGMTQVTNSAEPYLNAYVNQQIQQGNPATNCTTLSGVVCQGSNQSINQNPELRGVVKLNPYDFPLAFSQCPVQVPQATTSGLPAVPAAQANPTFTMANVFDMAAALYASAFPAGYHALQYVLPNANQNTSAQNTIANPFYPNIPSYIQSNRSGTYAPYPMGYLMLQGLCNGYLIMSQPNAPLTTSFTASPTLNSDIVTCMKSLPSLADVLPQPTAVQWFATPGFDYLILRSLMNMRYLVRNLYITAAMLPYMQYILDNPNSIQNIKNQYNVFAPYSDATSSVTPTVGACQTASTPGTAPSTTSSQSGAPVY